ncbi:unnamed protein product [Rhizoctonia solani]|uniref:Uncharacterized protein n=1 Tax=Rhizoctonia solani TaxID=456999 RepID=A0A8H3BJ42_9AGAM|nr:unnamed protein product [Rhizoctonia solani]
MRCILSFVVLYFTILTALAVPISPPPVPDLKQTDPTEGYAYINDIHLAPEDSTGARLLSGSSSPGAVYRHGDVIHGYSDYQQPLHYASVTSRVARTIFSLSPSQSGTPLPLSSQRLPGVWRVTVMTPRPTSQAMSTPPMSPQATDSLPHSLLPTP